MNNVDRAKMIHLLPEELEDSVTGYEIACDKRGSNFALAGLDENGGGRAGKTMKEEE